jgi:predicted nucleotidyltransferase component of viral defense system
MSSRAIQAAFHENPGRFRDAVLATARQTGFNEGLVEKDYYCSLVLARLAEGDSLPLVFKGGTAFSKVYLGFYRLSEDLDFIIPVTDGMTRAERSRAAGPTREAVDALATIPGMAVETPLTGHNQSRQYIAVLHYESAVGHSGAQVKVEVGLREPLLRDAPAGEVRTLLTDPFTGRPGVEAFTVRVLAIEEAAAEKVRAALTRREPAIRDFYDLGQLAERRAVEFLAPGVLELVAAKLRVGGTPTPDISPARLAVLEDQVQAELRPVLPRRQFEAFDLGQSVALLRRILAALETPSASINPG